MMPPSQDERSGAGVDDREPPEMDLPLGVWSATKDSLGLGGHGDEALGALAVMPSTGHSGIEECRNAVWSVFIGNPIPG
jgi:hypothetical protein